MNNPEELVTYTAGYYAGLYMAGHYAELYERMYSECRPPPIDALRRRLIEASDKAGEIRKLANEAISALWHQDVMRRNNFTQRNLGLPLRRSVCSSCNGMGGKRTGTNSNGHTVFADPCVGVEEWCYDCCGIGWRLKMVRITEDDIL